MKLALVAILALSLAACGGTSKAADTTPAATEATDPAGEPTADGNCCCEFIIETGEGDDMSENMISRMMTSQQCDDESGTCVGDAACIAPL
jgi:hypothetical protein